MKTQLSKENLHIYQHIANNIEMLIIGGALKIGDKLPSVRMLGKERGISVSTAFQAYYALEGKGLIEARCKSGYYVKYNPRKFPKLPQIIHPEAKESNISVEEIASRVYKELDSEKVIRFSLALPSVDLLPVAKLNKAITRSIQKAKDSCTGYEHTLGNPELRKQVSKLSFNWSGQITEEEIIVTSGCNEALVTCLKASTKVGDTVAIESPTYFGMLRILQLLGLKAVEIPTDPTSGVDLDILKKYIPKFNIKACLFIPNFNNPLGCCMPDNHKRELVTILADYEIPLIEDDIYGELYFGAQRPLTCKSFDKNGLVFTVLQFPNQLYPAIG